MRSAQLTLSNRRCEGFPDVLVTGAVTVHQPSQRSRF